MERAAKKVWRRRAGWLFGFGVLAYGGAVLHAEPRVSVVTGGDATTRAAGQAETVYNLSVVGATRVETVAYNDETSEVASGFIQYTDTQRTIFPGYSLMGWSSRVRTAASPDPAWTHAKLRPPPGTDALWGDPAITSHPDLPQVVLLSSLAVPHDKFPTPAILGTVAEGCTPLGGACVARSTDGGVSFSMVSCFGDHGATGSMCPAPLEVTKGHFYDGGAAAITRSGNTFTGFVGFIDVELGREAVWRLDDVTASTGTFVLDRGKLGSLGTLPEPESLGDIDTHMRLRADGADLWKMSLDGSSLKINVRGRNAPFKVIADNAESGFTVSFPNDAAGRSVGVRTGPQFAFDFGLNELGVREMRFVYAAAEGGLHFIQGGFCSMDLSHCERPTAWRLPAFGANAEFHPTLAFGVVDPTTGVGVWRTTFQGTTGGGVALFAADLVRLDLVPASPTANPITGLAFTAVTPVQTPCPDLRLFGGRSQGYWGDYHDMGFDPVARSFVRPFTDSSQGCPLRQALNSSHVHVSTVELPLTARVPIAGTIDITDQENIGANEHAHVDVNDACVVDGLHPVDSHFSIHPCAGDEVVVILDLTCTLQGDGAVKVDAHAELLEGDSCDLDEEVEDTKDPSVTVAAMSSQALDIDLTHDCFNCGDHAEIRLTATYPGLR